MNLESQTINPDEPEVFTLMVDDCTAENEMRLLRKLQHKARVATQSTPKKNLIIDLQQVRCIKPSTINAFVAALTILHDYDCRVVLKNITDDAWVAFKKRNLTAYFSRDTPSETSDSDYATM